MTDPTRRLIVDGVEFSRVFQFPRVLSAIGQAMQPGRLTAALLLVVAVICAGRLWDGITEPNIHPAGLNRGTADAAVQQQYQDALRVALNSLVNADDRDQLEIESDQALDATKILELAGNEYTRKKHAFESGENDSEDEESASRIASQIEVLHNRYANILGELDSLRPRGTFEASMDAASHRFGRMVRGVIYLDAEEVHLGLHGLIVALPVSLWQHDRTFTIVFGFIFIILISLGGGALSRMAACDTARFERVRVRDAYEFAFANWFKLLFTALLPLLIALGLCLILAVGGFVLLSLPWVDVLGGLFYGLALLLGFVIAFVIVGFSLGFSMLIPAVACECCDAAEAMQRAFAYALGRPLHLLGYGVTGLIGGALGFVIVSLFALLILNITAAATGMWTGSPVMPEAGGFVMFQLNQPNPMLLEFDGHQQWTGGVINFWQSIVVLLVGAYVIGYFFSASTIIYLLMRRASDGQDIEEIWQNDVFPGSMTPMPDAVESGAVSAKDHDAQCDLNDADKIDAN